MVRKQIGVDEYYSQISDHVTLLGNYYFNSYLVRGSRFSAIVEMGVTATVDLIFSQLEKIQVAPDYLIVTHPHADHITGLTGLMERFPGATVVTGKGAKQFIEHPKASQAIISEDNFISNALEKIGAKPGRPPVDQIPELSDAIEIDGKFRIDLGGVDVECFTVYGHAPGNILVNVKTDRVVLVSDSLGFHFPGRGLCPLFFTGFREYIETLSYLKGLDPEIIGLGHQGPIGGERVSRIFDEAENTAQNVVAMVENDIGHSAEVTDKLFGKYYVDEFTLYSPENIRNCMNLLVKRAQEANFE